ncbi:hypothetical protein E2C01_069755 [Portunus trituberculatus]|uniref:Uncharacterized protein n=1 Tax=Portunus trituberculatus TaxID=210409 RepID=A0A5B7I0F1_PORTR|nr:hypothetical protein [Portunus trituberculatus]
MAHGSNFTPWSMMMVTGGPRLDTNSRKEVHSAVLSDIRTAVPQRVVRSTQVGRYRWPQQVWKRSVGVRMACSGLWVLR